MKKLKLICPGVLMLLAGFAYAQVTQYPYTCSFETGPDNAAIVDYEPHWHGSDDWLYDDATSLTGNYCAYLYANTTSYFGHLFYVHFDCSNQSNIQPSFWYNATNQNIALRILGRVNYGNWVVLKDWFIPGSGSWQLLDYTELSNLSMFDNQSNCNFGITAVKNTGSGTLRMDDIQILTGGGVPLNTSWLTSAADNDWHSPANWDNGVPDINSNTTIPAGAIFYPQIINADAQCNNLSIQAGAELSIDSAYQLDIAGDLLIESDNTADGSFLNRGNLNMNGPATYRRYIEQYTNHADGWHLVSSPVNSFAVGGSDFEPGANDDLYRWDEASCRWLNYKVQPFDFTNGSGYLIASETSGIKSFTGNFNETDIVMHNLSAGTGSGWHLLGNPFPCALIWNDGNWMLNNIEGIAKIYDESAGNYMDVAALGIIPPTQGFFVRAVSASNGLEIPAASRTHSTRSFFKQEAAYPGFVLTVKAMDNEYCDRNTIYFREDATPDYDHPYDGQKMFGRDEAPQLYMDCGSGELLSTNALNGSEAEIVLHFEAGEADQYLLTADHFYGIEEDIRIYLEDTFQDNMLDLKTDSAYCFSARRNDPTARFRLHIQKASGLGECIKPSLNVYQSAGNIHIYNPEAAGRADIYSLSGQFIDSFGLHKGHNIVPVHFSTGVYLIKTGKHTNKIIIKPWL